MKTYFPTELVTKVKPNITSVEVHRELSNNGHPLCTGWCWFTVATSLYISASDFFWGGKVLQPGDIKKGTFYKKYKSLFGKKWATALT
jgi:hypothetical protein